MKVLQTFALPLGYAAAVFGFMIIADFSDRVPSLYFTLLELAQAIAMSLDSITFLFSS
jgi:hypothetical protein